MTGVRLLEECITFDLIISNKLRSFVALYRSPCQSQDDFATFSDNFEMTLDLSSKKNPYLLVVLGDFSATTKTKIQTKIKIAAPLKEFPLKILLRSFDYIR